MRRTRSALTFALLVLAAGAGGTLVLGAAAGCGGSQIGAAYDAFYPVADRILSREDAIWRQVQERNATLDDDPTGARFYPYLETTAAPFYDTCEKELAAADPGPAETAGPVREAWTALRAFVSARRDFIRLELERRNQMKYAGDLVKLRDLQDHAASAVIAYEEAVADDVPDYRLGEMKLVVQRVTKEQLEPAVKGDRAVSVVVEHVRKVAVPALERLRDSRFEDDDRSRLLRRAIVLNEESMRRIGELAEPLLAMARAITASTRAATEAEAAKQLCWDALAAARRDR